jgi:hypothetical protein
MAGIPDVTNKLEEKNAANKNIYQEVRYHMYMMPCCIKKKAISEMVYDYFFINTY